MQADGSLSIHPAPAIAGWRMTYFSGIVFSHTFSGLEPPGPHHWLAADAGSGTLNLLGLHTDAPFINYLKESMAMKTTIDLTQFKLESHVEKSFRLAMKLSSGERIKASHAIRAAISLGRLPQASPAFKKLVEFLPLKAQDKQQAESLPKSEIMNVPVDPSLAVAFSTAEPFLHQFDKIRGRDFITFVLLAIDPTLTKMVEKINLNLGSVRDMWFEFISSSSSRRENKSWMEWWHKASVPLPQERKIHETGRHYLLTWDPKLTPFDDLKDIVQRVKTEGSALGNWSIGKRGAAIGDKMFFMRQGSQRPGLIGSGQIVSEPWKARHWNPELAETRSEFYANILWNELYKYPAIPLDDLKKETGEKELWELKGSGFEIAKEIARVIQRIWPKKPVLYENHDIDPIAQATAILYRMDDEPIGQAFLIAPNTALTAGHVVETARKVTLKFINQTSGAHIVRTAFVEIDKEFDYAVLKLEDAVPPEVKPLKMEPAFQIGSSIQSWIRGSDISEFIKISGEIKDIIRMSTDKKGPVRWVLKHSMSVTYGSGSMGAPICVDGRVVGVLGYTSERDFLAIPSAAILGDNRIRNLIGMSWHSLEPVIWITIAGSQQISNDEIRNFARKVGNKIARFDAGIITGGSAGFDSVTTYGYFDERIRNGKIPLVAVPDTGWRPQPFFDRVRLFSSTEDWIDSSIAYSNLVIIFDGADSIRDLALKSFEKNRPVLTFPNTGPGAKSLLNEKSFNIPGIDQNEYSSIPKLSDDDLIDLLDRVLTEIIKKAPEEEIRSVPSEQGSDSLSDVPVIMPDTHPYLINDDVKGPDLLDFSTLSKTFARVMIARELEPPLSIGLFGTWGSGKSYFMNLIREDIKQLIRADDRDSWSNVCSIEFNAWHYMDSKLWATLAGRIFDGLADCLVTYDENTNETPADARRRLRARLRSSCEARVEAVRSQELALGTLKKRRKEFEEKQIEYEKKLSEISGVLNKEMWNVLSEQAKQGELAISPDKALEAAKNLGLLPVQLSGEKQKDPEQKDMKSELSLKSMLTTADEANAMVADLRSLHGQFKTIADGLKPGSWIQWIIGLLVVFGPALLELALSYFNKNANLTGAATVTGQIAVIAGTKMKDLRKKMGEVSTISGFVESIRRKGETTRRLALERIGKEDRNQVIEAQSAWEQAQAQLNQVEQTISDLQKELEALDAGQAVYKFVRERGAEGGRYREREGIISMVRRDLISLSGLLKDWVRSEKESKDEDPMPPDAVQLSRNEREKLPIQRIILYIDDLDRCPSKRVVEVLQAVHLLLAFDLFVVVVGVDPRWLERSLLNAYGNLLGDVADDQSIYHHKAATAQDYLEKIFQIPYTLPEVNTKGFKSLLSDNLKIRTELDSDIRPDDPPKNEGDDDGESKAEVYKKKNSNQPGEVDEPENQDDIEETDPLRGIKGQDNDEALLSIESENERKGAENGMDNDVRNSAHGYYFEPWAREFLERLHVFLSTPRVIKRFSNIYRLIRVGVGPEDFHKFIGKPDARKAEYRVAAVELGLNTGFPRLGTGLLRAIAWPESITANKKFDTFAEFLEIIDPFQEHSNSKNPILSLGVQEMQDLRVVHPLLVQFSEETHENIEVWRHWAKIVGRYSMYWRAF